MGVGLGRGVASRCAAAPGEGRSGEGLGPSPQPALRSRRPAWGRGGGGRPARRGRPPRSAPTTSSNDGWRARAMTSAPRRSHGRRSRACQRGSADAQTGGDHRRSRVEGHGDAVHRDPDAGQPVLRLLAVESAVTQVGEHEVYVGASGEHVDAGRPGVRLEQPFGQDSAAMTATLACVPECGCTLADCAPTAPSPGQWPAARRRRRAHTHRSTACPGSPRRTCSSGPSPAPASRRPGRSSPTRSSPASTAGGAPHGPRQQRSPGRTPRAGGPGTRRWAARVLLGSRGLVVAPYARGCVTHNSPSRTSSRDVSRSPPTPEGAEQPPPEGPPWTSGRTARTR